MKRATLQLTNQIKREPDLELVRELNTPTGSHSDDFLWTEAYKLVEVCTEEGSGGGKSVG